MVPQPQAMMTGGTVASSGCTAFSPVSSVFLSAAGAASATAASCFLPQPANSPITRTRQRASAITFWNSFIFIVLLLCFLEALTKPISTDGGKSLTGRRIQGVGICDMSLALNSTAQTEGIHRPATDGLFRGSVDIFMRSAHNILRTCPLRAAYWAVCFQTPE